MNGSLIKNTNALNKAINKAIKAINKKTKYKIIGVFTSSSTIVIFLFNNGAT